MLRHLLSNTTQPARQGALHWPIIDWLQEKWGEKREGGFQTHQHFKLCLITLEGAEVLLSMTLSACQGSLGIPSVKTT